MNKKRPVDKSLQNISDMLFLKYPNGYLQVKTRINAITIMNKAHLFPLMVQLIKQAKEELEKEGLIATAELVIEYFENKYKDLGEEVYFELKGDK